MCSPSWTPRCQSRFNARCWMLGAGALGRPRGMVWGGRREEGSGYILFIKRSFSINERHESVLKFYFMQKNKVNELPFFWEFNFFSFLPCTSCQIMRKLHSIPAMFLFFNFLFYSGLWLINNVVRASGAQQSDSAIHISILSQISFHISWFTFIASLNYVIIIGNNIFIL